ncbi:TraK domain-containing protein [Lamprocystis purpurea]|jgi:conjugal transfer pilus assembly protein TraK|uniref:TraK domain-containing protein n=1 Tax=Lamprocystis purpurea TaxID=61598 RepID=UPI00037950E4|nr:type-F conjugative transfer system secretin TraK [Lamprocystis purpurea]
MIRPRTLRSTTALLACLAAGAAAEPEPGVALPGVSCALLQETPGAPARPVTGTGGTVPVGPPTIRLVGGQGSQFAPATAGFQRVALRTEAPPVAMELGPRNLTVTPGTTVLVEVAIGHLNRLVTPFANPVVHTVSSASTSVDGRVVYVATSGEEPIALWITDGQGGESALSLTLAPRYVPPREIRVTVPGYRPKGGTGSAAGAGASPARVESVAGGDGFGAASYVEGLTDLLRAMAQQRLPPGFQVVKAPFKAHCAANLKVNKTQLTEGPSASVLTVGVRNGGQDSIAITESSCDVPQHSVAAVGAWPLKTLGPGQETEVFLVLQQGAGAAVSGQPQ